MNEPTDPTLLDALQAADPALIEHAWGALLAELIEVTEAHFRRGGRTEEDARREAQGVILAIASYAGGRQLYIPKAHRLRIALRDLQIWREFTGHNYAALARRHGDLSITQMYNIIGRQRRLRRRRDQMDLFSEAPE